MNGWEKQQQKQEQNKMIACRGLKWSGQTYCCICDKGDDDDDNKKMMLMMKMEKKEGLKMQKKRRKKAPITTLASLSLIVLGWSKNKVPCSVMFLIFMTLEVCVFPLTAFSIDGANVTDAQSLLFGLSPYSPAYLHIWSMAKSLHHQGSNLPVFTNIFESIKARCGMFFFSLNFLLSFDYLFIYPFICLFVYSQKVQKVVS